jgi:long-chain acyl-CoA synthetase
MFTLTEGDLPLERVYRWEREQGDRVFLTQPYGGGKVREWTWGQAVGEARCMAAYLRAQGWEPGTRVAILSKNCAWWVMADIAAWMAGYVSVPVYPSLKAQSVRQILEHCGARACFVGATDNRETAAQGIPEGIRRISFPTAAADGGTGWDQAIAGRQPLEGYPTRTAEELATIIYTSGTTGLPKGVMHTFGGFRFSSLSLTAALDLKPQQRVLSYLPLAHIVERAGLEMLSVHLSWHLYFTEGIETFLEDLHRARPTIFLSVPRLLLKFQQGVFRKLPQDKLERLLRIPLVKLYVRKRVLHQLGLDSVEKAACGAAPLPTEILMWYRRLGLELVEGYGMTESMITHLPRPGKLRPGYVGTAVPGVECQTGDKGELLVRSPMNMLGYYRDPEATAAAFTADRFFRTGDVVELLADGQLRIIGRVKEQFKTSKGKYVAPAPIESRLAEHSAVEACCLMGAGLPSPFALVVLTEEARRRSYDPKEREALERSLRTRLEDLNADLDPHERPSMIVIADGPWDISSGFMTPTLKIRRAALENHYAAHIEGWRDRGSAIVWETFPAMRMTAYDTLPIPGDPIGQSD